MNQSAIIGGSLLAGFALFLAARNRLSAYGRVMVGSKPATHEGGEAGADSNAKENSFDILDPLGDWGYSLKDAMGDLDNLLGEVS